jgi:hypothetical protein
MRLYCKTEKSDLLKNLLSSRGDKNHYAGNRSVGIYHPVFTKQTSVYDALQMILVCAMHSTFCLLHGFEIFLADCLYTSFCEYRNFTVPAE